MDKMLVSGWIVGWMIVPYVLHILFCISVYDVCARGWVVQFKTILQGLIRAQWYELVVKLNNFPINDSKDVTY
jgi:hypothetical protein